MITTVTYRQVLARVLEFVHLQLYSISLLLVLIHCKDLQSAHNQLDQGQYHCFLKLTNNNLLKLYVFTLLLLNVSN